MNEDVDYLFKEQMATPSKQLHVQYAVEIYKHGTATVN